MTEVLLKELSKSDIDWITATGRRRQVPAGTVLVEQGKAADWLHILLDGSLTISISQVDNSPLGRAFAAIEGDEISSREIARLSSGEVVGEIPFESTNLATTTVKATEKSLVMSIPRQEFAAKLQQDVDFAARFYRAITIILSDRLQSIINELGRSKLAQGQQMADVLNF